MSELSLDALLARLVDETIRREEFVELERHLAQNPQAQRRYLHYLDMHAELQVRGPNVAKQTASPVSPRGRRTLVGLALAASGLLALLACLLFWQARPPADRVRITDSDGPAQWIGADGRTRAALKADVTLPSGTLETKSADGWLSFRFPDETTVSMAGRSLLAVSSEGGQDILRLERGTISVKASPRKPERALLVLTPSAKAEVLGTQFNLQAGDYATRIVVNEGRVRVTRLADGEVAEVGADEVLVAALEQGAAFEAVPRRAVVERWQSVLPRDLRQGRWEPADEQNPVGGARAMPHLWKGEPGLPEKATLLYTTVLDPSPKRAAPFRLAADARLRVQGRMAKQKQRIQFGFATNTPHGGLAGKYAVPTGIDVQADPDGRFTIDLDLAEFLPVTERYPPSPIGQEVVYLWIQTVEVDAGLLVEGVQWGPKSTTHEEKP